MKKYFFSLLSGLILVSCAGRKIQVATLQSPDLKSDSGTLYFENDTLLLKYNFYSNRGIVNFSVFNKLKIPLYIDWKKTAFIVGKQKMDYWTNESFMSGYANNYYYGSWHATVSKNERITFIPPGTEIERRSYILMNNRNFTDLKNTAPEKTNASWNPQKTTTIKQKSYTPDNSPVSFRNFITYSTQNDFSKESYIDNSFWVKDIIEMTSKQYMGKIIGRNNEYYIYQLPYKAPNVFYIQ